jgi:hypothetical protein
MKKDKNHFIEIDDLGCAEALLFAKRGHVRIALGATDVLKLLNAIETQATHPRRKPNPGAVQAVKTLEAFIKKDYKIQIRANVVIGEGTVELVCPLTSTPPSDGW